MADDTSLTTTQDHNAIIQAAATKLIELADSKEDDLKDRILVLAQLTQPEIKGVEGTGNQFRITELRMRQPTSQAEGIPEDCKPGQLYNTDGDALGGEMRFIPILNHAIRKKWGEDNKIDCVSMDGVQGTHYGKCGECPYGKFEQGQPVECSPGNSFYVVTPELDALYRIDFQKSSAKAGRNIIRLTKPPALWGKSFSLSTAHQTGNNRNYYTLVTKPTGTRVDSDTMEVCELLHEVFHAHYKRALEGLMRFSEAGQTTGEAPVVVSEEEGGKIDFSESM